MGVAARPVCHLRLMLPPGAAARLRCDWPIAFFVGPSARYVMRLASWVAVRSAETAGLIRLGTLAGSVGARILP